MPVDPNEHREKIFTILKTLSEHEQELFKRVLRIEKDNIHIPKRPHVKDDLLRAVRESIK